MNNRWRGVVTDIDDPLQLGRVRVRIYHLHGDNDADVPNDKLPFAIVQMGTMSSSSSGVGISPTWLRTGSSVTGYFVDKEQQIPIIDGTFYAKRDNAPTGAFGNNEYPKWTGESEVNRLARGIKDNTYLIDREAQRTKGIKTAFNYQAQWEEKESKYNAKYPLNHVIETPNGHIIELDDTDGSERIMVRHKGGSYIEIFPDGSIQKRVNDDYSIIDGDNKTKVAGDMIANVGGNVSFLVSGDTNIQSGGNINVQAGGDIKMKAGKNIQMQAGGSVYANGQTIQLNLSGAGVYF